MECWIWCFVAVGIIKISLTWTHVLERTRSQPQASEVITFKFGRIRCIPQLQPTGFCILQTYQRVNGDLGQQKIHNTNCSSCFDLFRHWFLKKRLLLKKGLLIEKWTLRCGWTSVCRVLWVILIPSPPRALLYSNALLFALFISILSSFEFAASI